MPHSSSPAELKLAGFPIPPGTSALWMCPCDWEPVRSPTLEIPLIVRGTLGESLASLNLSCFVGNVLIRIPALQSHED